MYFNTFDAVGGKIIRTSPQACFFPLVLHYKKLLRSFYQQYIMSSLYNVILRLGTSISLKNEEKHINILERKIIRSGREDVYFTY